MIQLEYLNTEKAGSKMATRRFPFCIGRNSGMDLVLSGNGVWEKHAEIAYIPREGYCIKTLGEGAVIVNGERKKEERLRNGDFIDLGSVKLRFWLAPLEQYKLAMRENLTWIGLALLCLFQVVLIYRLL